MAEPPPVYLVMSMDNGFVAHFQDLWTRMYNRYQDYFFTCIAILGLDNPTYIALASKDIV
jgi:hypothetical protein